MRLLHVRRRSSSLITILRMSTVVFSIFYTFIPFKYTKYGPYMAVYGRLYTTPVPYDPLDSAYTGRVRLYPYPSCAVLCTAVAVYGTVESPTRDEVNRTASDPYLAAQSPPAHTKSSSLHSFRGSLIDDLFYSTVTSYKKVNIT
jgi:hypothetical protein